MSLPVATTISGTESMGVLRQNLEIIRGFQPLDAAAMQVLRDRCRFDASDGRWELFKTTKKYDGDPGRKQHEFPAADELPGNGVMPGGARTSRRSRSRLEDHLDALVLFIQEQLVSLRRSVQTHPVGDDEARVDFAPLDPSQ